MLYEYRKKRNEVHAMQVQPISQQSPSSPQRPHKRKHTKVAKIVCSLLGAIAAIIAILGFLGIPSLPSLLPTPTPTHTFTSIPTNTPTPIPSPTSIPIHLVTCSAASTDPNMVKFFTQGGGVVCFSGVGTINHVVQPVVRVETGATFATWQYVTLSTGVSHHSPQNSPYNCPSKIAHYEGSYMMRVTQITIVSNSTSCS